MKGMKANAIGPAATPKFVRTALFANVMLVLISLAAPIILPESEAIAFLFAIPMALILVVGAFTAIGAYILARREFRPVRWTAFLPLAVFLVGIAGTLLLVQVDSLWERDPVEFRPGSK
jgi:hypothetical protein